MGTKSNYRGRYIDRNMILNDENWPSSIESDLEPVPIPKLKPSRILHIKQTILPHIKMNALPWWNSIAPEDGLNYTNTP